MRVQATAAEMAAMAPTERSMPRVAITRVMPRATSSTGALLRTMSMRLPYRWPSCIRMSRNPGFATTLTTSSTSRARTGHTSWCWRIRWRPVGDSGMGTLLLAGLARDDLEDVADTDVVVGALVDLAPVAHDHEAVAEP